MLQSDSNCVDEFFHTKCTWNTPSPQVGNLIWGTLTDNCKYNPAPGSTAAWRYGCSIGFSPNDLIDNRGSWQFGTVRCNVQYLHACRPA